MSTFGKKLKINKETIGKTTLATLMFMLSLPLESEATDNFFERLFGNKQIPQQVGGNAQQSARTAERQKATIKAAAEKKEAERQAKEKEIATRIAFEKESAQKQIAQQQEDKRKAEARRQQLSSVSENQARTQQPVHHTSEQMRLATEAHQAGKSFGSNQLNNAVSAAKSTNPRDVPGFQTDKPKEAFLNAETLGDAALAQSRTNETAQHLHTQAKDRKKFKIDPDTDPLFVEANRIMTNPQKALNEEIIATSDASEGVSEEIKTCEEGGDEYSQSCSKRLEIVLKITPEIKRTIYSCPGHTREEWQWHGWNSGYITRTDYCGGCQTQTVIDQYKEVRIDREKWIDGCAVLEDLTEKGLCRYESKTTSTKNETRSIQQELITRDHFEEHYRYTCFKAPPVSKSCIGLREKGCFQIGSTCKEKIGDTCVLCEQTYSCPSGKKSQKSYRTSNSENPFCLTGNCADTSYEANNEMMNAMSHLYALREAQNDLRDFKVIFKGTHRWCTRNCLGFRDCCGGAKGWGVTLHLSDCDKAEIELRTLRDKHLCIQVGTYCAERDAIFDSCIRKKTTFCCYGTKMARLIQENGRAQLGLGWGKVESPDCSGLSPEQLSRIDFSKINFSEIFEDIQSKTVVKDQKQSLAAVSTERLQDNMTLLTKQGVDRRPPVDTKSHEHPDASLDQDLQKLKEKGL